MQVTFLICSVLSSPAYSTSALHRTFNAQGPAIDEEKISGQFVRNPA